MKRIDPFNMPPAMKRTSEDFTDTHRPSKASRPAEIAPSWAVNSISAAKLKEIVGEKRGGDTRSASTQ